MPDIASIRWKVVFSAYTGHDLDTHTGRRVMGYEMIGIPTQERNISGKTILHYRIIVDLQTDRRDKRGQVLVCLDMSIDPVKPGKHGIITYVQ